MRRSALDSPDLIRKASMAVGLLLALLASILCGIFLRAHLPRRFPPHLTLSFLDVGAGDCTVALTPDKHVIVIDAGPAESGRAVIDTLRQRGISTIDLLVLTSPDPGSIGGVPALLSSGIDVNEVWDNTVNGAGNARRAALEAIRTRHIPSRIAHAGDHAAFGSSPMTLTVLWPPENDPRARTDGLVCRIDYNTPFNSLGVTLAAASNSTAEQYLVDRAGDKLACDILQVPAQGQDPATAPELLRRAAPSYAVISCSAARKPGPGVLHRLLVAGADVWRTDTLGTITVTADGKTPLVITASRE